MNMPALPPPQSRFAPTPTIAAPLVLRGVNPDLSAPSLGGPPPDASGADWKRFVGGLTGAPTGDKIVYTPGPSLEAVKSGSAEMSKGHSGPGVTQLQAGLRRSGEKLDVDGKFGPQTEGAVSNFQRKHNLPETGVVDAATAKALEAAAPAPQPKPTPRPNGGGGGGGGGGKVTPPTPPNVPKLPSNPYAAQGAVYDLATKNLQNYHKGSNPAFDAVVTKLMDSPVFPLPGGGDPEYGKMLEAESRFRGAAKAAGF